MGKSIEKVLKGINNRINKNFAKNADVYREPIGKAFNQPKDEVDNKEDISMSESNVGISSPWIRYVHKIKALFGKDPEIHIDWNDEKMLLTLRVDNQRKSDALSELLPVMKKFGNVDILINVVPANKIDKCSINTIKAAFEGNPIVSKYYEVPDVMTNRMYYMMFEPEDVQYYDYNLADPRGFVSTLYQDIAADIIEEHDGVYFCTDDYINKESGDE